MRARGVTERERVRGTVRKAADGDARRIHVAVRERVVQRAVDHVDIEAEAELQQVPCPAARLRHEQDDARAVRRWIQVVHQAPALPRTVQHDE
jgi:hypothetical protein